MALMFMPPRHIWIYHSTWSTSKTWFICAMIKGDKLVQMSSIFGSLSLKWMINKMIVRTKEVFSLYEYFHKSIPHSEQQINHNLLTWCLPTAYQCWRTRLWHFPLLTFLGNLQSIVRYVQALSRSKSKWHAVCMLLRLVFDAYMIGSIYSIHATC